ncbi:MAG TPA: site-specific integrase [Terracidiphilus sp.]
MLKTLYPTCFRRYSSLAIFGPIVDGFSTWLVEQRYNHAYLKHRICLLLYIEAVLIRRGVRHVNEIGQDDWAACRRSLLRRFPDQTGTTCALERYLHVENLLRPTGQKVASAAARYLAAYADYLETVRGAAASTIQQNSYTASEFLAHLKIEKHPGRLKTLTINDLETFVKKISQRLSRASLRTIIGRLRGFLRFLAMRGEISQGLEGQVDTPRVYQEEQLPHALPWETVRTFLDSIDRSTSVGLRDFTMFLLMATYGLRASDVVALTLDDIHWRAGKISISQRKTGTFLELPLTDEMGTALHRYLKKVPPPPPFRQIFLRVKAPIGTLQTTAISTSFRVWARRSGVALPGRGSSHRVRHSYAVFLLRKGTSLKTIGDLLGHRTVESTWTYLRLAIEDLRDVALPMPAESKAVRA